MRRSFVIAMVLAAFVACFAFWASGVAPVDAGSRPSGTPFGAIVFVNSAPNGVVRGSVGQVAIDRATSIAWQNTNGAMAWSRFIGTAQIEDASVSLAKMANVASGRFLARTTAGTGSPESLTATQVTALLDVGTSALKGVVPASGGGTTNFLRSDFTWAAAGGTDTRITTALVGTDATSTDTTALTEATGLTLSLTAGTYQYEYRILWRVSAVSSTMQYNLDFSGSTAFFVNVAIHPTDSAGTVANMGAGGSQASLISGSARRFATSAIGRQSGLSVDTPASDMLLVAHGTLEVTATGSLKFWFAPEVASTLTIKAGSSLVVTKVQ